MSGHASKDRRREYTTLNVLFAVPMFLYNMAVAMIYGITLSHVKLKHKDYLSLIMQVNDQIVR
jgi:putative Mn2+ efflux pump MntP